MLREGFEPGQLENASDENVAVEDPKEDGIDGKAKASTGYGNLDDGNVWKASED